MYPCPKYSWSTGSCSTCFRTGGIGITAFWPTAFGQKRSHCAVNYWKERRLRPKNNPLKSLLFPGSRLQSVPPVAMPRFTGRRNCPPAGSDFLLLLRYVPRCRLPNSGRSVTHHELSGRESVRCFDLFSRSVSVEVCAGSGHRLRESPHNRPRNYNLSWLLVTKHERTSSSGKNVRNHRKNRTLF